jgi:hypothetical protein
LQGGPLWPSSSASRDPRHVVSKAIQVEPSARAAQRSLSAAPPSFNSQTQATSNPLVSATHPQTPTLQTQGVALSAQNLTNYPHPDLVQRISTAVAEFQRSHPLPGPRFVPFGKQPPSSKMDGPGLEESRRRKLSEGPEIQRPAPQSHPAPQRGPLRGSIIQGEAGVSYGCVGLRARIMSLANVLLLNLPQRRDRQPNPAMGLCRVQRWGWSRLQPSCCYPYCRMSSSFVRRSIEWGIEWRVR